MPHACCISCARKPAHNTHVSCQSAFVLPAPFPDLDIPPSNFKFVGVTNDVMSPEGLHYITLFMSVVLPADAVPINAEPDKCEGACCRLDSLCES